MIKHINKTRIALAILTFLVLTLCFRACSAEFNSKLFIEQAESMHLKDAKVLGQYKSITDIRTEINTYIKHDSVFDPYLDEICSNVVGNTMMKLLVANLKVKLLDTESSIISLCEDSGSGAEHGNRFNPSSNIVYINFGLYTFGIKNTKQCGVRDGVVIPKTSDVADALFHELCHAFHFATKTRKNDTSTLMHIYRGSTLHILTWEGKRKTDEELYNITGYYYDGIKISMDPISCNMYNICKYAATPDSIIQRVFHWSWESLQSKPVVDPLYKIDQFLIDLNQYVLTKS